MVEIVAVGVSGFTTRQRARFMRLLNLKDFPQVEPLVANQIRAIIESD